MVILYGSLDLGMFMYHWDGFQYFSFLFMVSL